MMSVETTRSEACHYRSRGIKITAKATSRGRVPEPNGGNMKASVDELGNGHPDCPDRQWMDGCAESQPYGIPAVAAALGAWRAGLC